MKKCDLHIHTVKGISDREIVFSMNVLKEYVEKMHIDVIAITNHDLFDYNNYMVIQRELPETIVLPGIEVDLEKGHILVIADNKDDVIFDFISKCNAVREKIRTDHDSISLDLFCQIFGDLNNYLLIPHYDKTPSLPQPVIEQLSDYIQAGEVTSIKKFLSMQKSPEERLTPVLFSDFRCEETDNVIQLPVRQTFLDINEVSVGALKLCLQDKSKATLSEKDGNKLFQVFDDGQMLSTGLNIMYGKRSTGKSFTMDKIYEIYGERAKYIEQFDLLNKGQEYGKEQFVSDQKIRLESKVAEYFKPFKDVVDKIILLPSSHSDETEVENYLNALMKKAEMENQNDIYSNTKLYEETCFGLSVNDELKKLIEAVQLLLESVSYRELIDKRLDKNLLKLLLKEFVDLYRERNYENVLKQLSNGILSAVKADLTLYSAIPPVPDIDLYSIILRGEQRKCFEKIANSVKSNNDIYSENKGRFTIKVCKRAYHNASDIKKGCGTSTPLAGIYPYYQRPIAYLEKLKEYGVESSSIHKAFAGVDYVVLNDDGLEVSGGERSEFVFIQKIQDAQLYDILLIDEPESSFDNVFLNNQINGFIKKMSDIMPVVVSTHNSTIGRSIQPDYIIYAEKKVENGVRVFRRYSGFPGDKKLVSVDGSEISNFDVTLNSLEAGADVYDRRKEIYEVLKSR